MTPYELSRELHRELSPIAPRLSAALNRALVDIGEGSRLVGLPNGMSAGDQASFDERKALPCRALNRPPSWRASPRRWSFWKTILPGGSSWIKAPAGNPDVWNFCTRFFGNRLLYSQSRLVIYPFAALRAISKTSNRQCPHTPRSCPPGFCHSWWYRPLKSPRTLPGRGHPGWPPPPHRRSTHSGGARPHR